MLSNVKGAYGYPNKLEQIINTPRIKAKGGHHINHKGAVLF